MCSLYEAPGLALAGEYEYTAPVASRERVAVSNRRSSWSRLGQSPEPNEFVRWRLKDVARLCSAGWPISDKNLLLWRLLSLASKALSRSFGKLRHKALDTEHIVSGQRRTETLVVLLLAAVTFISCLSHLFYAHGFVSLISLFTDIYLWKPSFIGASIRTNSQHVV